MAEILVAVGDRIERGVPVARLDNENALESAVLLAEADLAVREATLMQTRSTAQGSRDEAQATLDQARSAAEEARAERVRRSCSTATSPPARRSMPFARPSSRPGWLSRAPRRRWPGSPPSGSTNSPT